MLLIMGTEHEPQISHDYRVVVSQAPRGGGGGDKWSLGRGKRQRTKFRWMQRAIQILQWTEKQVYVTSIVQSYPLHLGES